MKTPRTMEPLVQDGLIDEMIRPSNSGKEASVYAMACDGEMRCAKVCTEASQRGCHKQARCREGSNKVRVSRQARPVPNAAPTRASSTSSPRRTQASVSPSTLESPRSRHRSCPRADRRVGTRGSSPHWTGMRRHRLSPSTSWIRASIGKHCRHRRSQRCSSRPGPFVPCHTLPRALFARATCTSGSGDLAHRQAPHSASTGPSAGLARPRFQVPGYRPRNLVAGR